MDFEMVIGNELKLRTVGDRGLPAAFPVSVDCVMVVGPAVPYTSMAPSVFPLRIELVIVMPSPPPTPTPTWLYSPRLFVTVWVPPTARRPSYWAPCQRSLVKDCVPAAVVSTSIAV